MEISCRKCAPKASSRPFFNFGKQPKTAISCNKLFILEKDYEKALKRLISFEPSPF